MTVKNILYAQSGGVTAVINATALGVIQTAKEYPKTFGTIYAAKNGIIGALNDSLLNISNIDNNIINKLIHTPAGAFGSCRHKITNDGDDLEKLLKVFKKYNIGYFFYNGGGDSQDTANKIADFTKNKNFPVQCIGIPKTIDNDLPFTDNCPGFGSVAKYVAVSTLEASLDVRSMALSSTKVFILEVMGRHAGWIAAASGLAQRNPQDGPHIILFPEITFNETAFISKVENTYKKYGYVVIVVSEGIKNSQGKFLSEAGLKDAFGHAQLGGVAPQIASLIKEKLNLKYHYAIADYLQRSARHIASKVDVEQAFKLGKAAVELALNGSNAVMPIIVRQSSAPYQYTIGEVALSEVANQEKKMPLDFISEDGMHITDKCRQYLKPLIQGEDYPPYVDGLPDYITL